MTPSDGEKEDGAILFWFKGIRASLKMTTHFDKLNQSYQNVVRKCQFHSEHRQMDVDDYIERYLPTEIPRDCFPANFKEDTVRKYTETLASLQRHLQALRSTTVDAQTVSVNRASRYGKNGSVSSSGYEANKRYRQKHIKEQNQASLDRYNRLKEDEPRYLLRKERMREYARMRLAAIKDGTWEFKKPINNNVEATNKEENVCPTERIHFEELELYNREEETEAKEDDREETSTA